MGRVRVGLLAALAGVAFAAGCGADPVPQTPPAQDLPPAPTAAVGADGQPIASLCDLLTADDFKEITGVAVQAPAPSNATATSATCDYGANAQLVVQVAGSLDEAMTNYQTAVKGAPFATVVKEGPVGGIDESLHGVGSESAGLALRRQKLVVTIVVPGTPAEGEVQLIRLAGRVLDRVHALGT
jgi:hypothetical protein